MSSHRFEEGAVIDASYGVVSVTPRPVLRRLLRVLELAVAVEMRGNAQEGQESVGLISLRRGCVCCTALHMPARLAHFVGQHWGHHAQ